MFHYLYIIKYLYFIIFSMFRALQINFILIRRKRWLSNGRTDDRTNDVTFAYCEARTTKFLMNVHTKISLLMTVKDVTLAVHSRYQQNFLHLFIHRSYQRKLFHSSQFHIKENIYCL